MRMFSILLAFAAAFSLTACNSFRGGYPDVPTDAAGEKAPKSAKKK